MADAAVGFKEWQLVLERLGRGEQVLLLRKGGIHEGRAGFSFRHEEFFLLPSYFHQQQELLRIKEGEGLGAEPEGVHRIGLWARVDAAAELTDWAQVAALEAEHCWSAGLLRQRWDWAGKGMNAGSLTVALVRVFALAEVWEIPDGPGFGGCRSWFDLGTPPPGWREGLRPVLKDAEFAARAERIFRLAPGLAAARSAA